MIQTIIKNVHCNNFMCNERFFKGFVISDTIILTFISCWSPISLRYISNSYIREELERNWRCIGDMMSEEIRVPFVRHRD